MFEDDIYECSFLEEIHFSLIYISSNIASKSPTKTMPALFLILTGCSTTIAWSNDALVYWRIYALCGLDK